MISQLTKILGKSTVDEIRHSNHWYNKAHVYCLLLSQKYNVSMLKVVGILAALSPNNKWERNVIDVESFLINPSDTVSVATYNSNKRKAILIYNSEDSEIESILKGLKTTSFYKNILNPEESKEVTVDLWMYRMVNLKNTRRNYFLIKEMVNHIADDKKVPSNVIQANLWITYRRLYTNKEIN